MVTSGFDNIVTTDVTAIWLMAVFVNLQQSNVYSVEV